MKDVVRKWLTEQFGDDAALHEELYGQYAADMKGFIAKVSEAMKTSDTKTLASVAHTMKGMALQMGDTETADVSKALQIAGQSGTATVCAGLVPKLSELVAAL